MRRRDYRCPNGHVFEFVDSIHDPVHEKLPCPDCAEMAVRQVAVPIIGKIGGGEWVTEFPGGHVLPREEVERRLDLKPDNPFSDTYLAKTRDRRADMVDRFLEQDASGTLPKRPELTEAEIAVAKKAVKPS